MSLSIVLMFIGVVLLLFVIPGPAVMITLSQTIRGGRKAGISTGVGIAIADFIHTIASILGLSALLMTSAIAFDLIKYLGAAYLIFLGVTAFLEKSKKIDIPAQKKLINPLQSFRQAILIELLNPKTALFFLAFLPQFTRPTGFPIVYQLLVLGLIFVTMSILYTTFIAIVAGFISERLSKRKIRMSPWVNKVIGVIYFGIGIQLAIFNQK